MTRPRVWLLVVDDAVVQNFLTQGEAMAAGEALIARRTQWEVKELTAEWEMVRVDGRWRWSLVVIQKSDTSYHYPLDIVVHSYRPSEPRT